MQRRFATLDVFTERRFAGNPLAVVLDAGGLDTAAMQAIAREFNHPETVFVLPPQDPAHRARLRIFTPARELPFAGHPTVGTAVLLGAAGRQHAPAARSCWRKAIGPVRCTIEASSGERGRVRFVLPQLPAEVGPAPDEATIAAALSLCARRHRLWRPSAVALVGRQSLHLRAGDRARRDGACVARSRDLRRGIRRRRRGRGGLSLLRRVRRARARFSRPHVRAEDGDHRGSGDRLGRRRLRGCARALCRPAGRRAHARDRAGLRDGAPEPDPAGDDACRTASSPPPRSAATQWS